MLLCPNTTFCRTLLCSLFKEELERDGGHDVDKRLQKEFPKWFNNHVSVVMSIWLAVKKILVFVLCVCGAEFSYFRSGSSEDKNRKRLAKGCMHCHVDLIFESRNVRLAA